MPNWSYPNFPPYVANGWFLMPTFPSRWWHPVLGSQMVADANAFALLDRSWSPTPGLADMRRTESEAEVVIQHDIALSLMIMTGGTPSGTPLNVNRRSAAWQEVIDRGWLTTPLVAAANPIGGPAPVSEGRAPGVTQPPGRQGLGAVSQARSELVPPQAQALAAAISAGVPSGDPEAEKKRQQEDQKAMSQTPQQPGQPSMPPGPGQPQQPGQPGQQPGQGQPPHPGQPQPHDQPQKPGEHKPDQHKENEPHKPDQSGHGRK